MKPKTHIISSTLLALVFYYFTKSIIGSIAAFASGVFIDLDHLVDFWLSHPQKPFSLKEFFFPNNYMKRNQKAYVPLHSYELAILLWVVVISRGALSAPWLLGVSLGITLHLILDDIGNNMKTFSYFLIFRIYKKFRVFKEGN